MLSSQEQRTAQEDDTAATGAPVRDRVNPPSASARGFLGVDVVDAAVQAGAAGRCVDLLDAIPDAILGVDRGGRILIANRQAAALFDYPPERLIGGLLDLLIPGTARARHGPLVAKFFANPVPRPMGSGLPLAARRRDGEVFFADISLALVDSSAHGPIAVLMVRDASEHRRQRLIAAQYLVTHALAESQTLVAAAAAVLGAVGPASGAKVAALWAADGFGAVRFVDSWCASERERLFHDQSVDFVFTRGLGELGGVVADPRVQWSSDVLADPVFHRKELASELGLHAAVWVPFTDGHDQVPGVLELLFGVVRDPDPGMLRTLEGFAVQLAQYLALRRSEADRQRVLGQIILSVEDERRRIASELHDDTVQVLVASLLSIDRLDRSIDAGNERAHELLGTVRGTLAAATERTRHLMFDLRPQLLEAEGVMSAITEVANLAGHEAGFEVEVEVEAITERFDPAVEALLYRVMQEAIVNARKHARASRVRCSLRAVSGGVIAEVADDGVGFQVDDAIERARERLSFGLSTIVELIPLAGGRVEIESVPGDGTLVRIWLPVQLTVRGATAT